MMAVCSLLSKGRVKGQLVLKQQCASLMSHSIVEPQGGAHKCRCDELSAFRFGKLLRLRVTTVTRTHPGNLCSPRGSSVEVLEGALFPGPSCPIRDCDNKVPARNSTKEERQRTGHRQEAMDPTQLRKPV